MVGGHVNRDQLSGNYNTVSYTIVKLLKQAPGRLKYGLKLIT